MSVLYPKVNFKISFGSKPSRTSEVERKPSQPQWGRGNVPEGRVPHIRTDNGAAVEVFGKHAEATRHLQVSSSSAASSAFSGPHPRHREVPRPGVGSELWLPACTTAAAVRIQAASLTCTPAHGNTRSLTQRARPEVEPVSSWMLVGFVAAEPQRELPRVSSKSMLTAKMISD